MAQYGDYRHFIHIDSTHRNRSIYPYAGEFLTVVKDSSNTIVDPVALGYVMYQNTVTSYTSNSPNDFVTLSSAFAATVLENELLGTYIQIVNSARTIVRGEAEFLALDTARDTIFLSKPISGVVATDIVYIRQYQANPRLRTTAGAVSGATVVLTDGDSVDNTYQGNIIRPIASGHASYLSTAKILSYTGSTKIATLNAAISNLVITDPIEVHEVKDNFNTMSSAGSTISQNNSALHDIKLEWLRIPRQPLFINESTGASDTKTSLDKTISDFPYLIVQFGNSHALPKIFQTANIKAVEGQFLIPIEDMSEDLGKFITLKSSYNITMRFSPSQDIKFGVFLPNGTPVRFDTFYEKLTPVRPNPDLQISALFSVKRI
jgi:hypothetical protein